MSLNGCPFTNRKDARPFAVCGFGCCLPLARGRVIALRIQGDYTPRAPKGDSTWLCAAQKFGPRYARMTARKDELPAAADESGVHGHRSPKTPALAIDRRGTRLALRA